MIEYLPWSSKTLTDNLKRYAKGYFSCLDIELGGECNYHCVYCDSPDRKKECTLSIDGLGNLLSTGYFKWVYICGLGEPTYNKNQKMLIKLLRYCEKYNAQCSIFSNLSQLTDELVYFIQVGVLHIFFKYDSFNSGITSALYGIHNIRTQLNNVERIKKLVKVTDEMTNMAASIVPTRLNRDYIVPIVKECIDANIFPLLGELESSGKGATNYENLCLTKEELCELKMEVEEELGESYKIPVCSSVIAGIHFSYDGNITVDRYTGLSCHWFWLKEPEVRCIAKFLPEMSVEEIEEKLLDYRDGCIGNVKKYLALDEQIGGAFGGCGGDVYQIFQQYMKFHRGGV